MRASYVDLFEFAHLFHIEELGGELHLHIDEDLWATEAVLMEEFHSMFVTYQGTTVHHEWPADLVESQFWPTIVCGGAEYARTPYGSEPAPEGFTFQTNCGDCMALIGQYHGSGCDIERCPVCTFQMLSCDCDFEYQGG